MEEIFSLNDLIRSKEAVKTANGLLVRSPKARRTVLIYALSDLDGTANDEYLQESRRLSSMTPAKEAFAILAQSGIVTGICTARSAGEAQHYRQELGTTGPIIAENGAVVYFPDGSRETFGELGTLASSIKEISVRLKRPIPNSIDFPGLQAAWEKERRGETPPFLGHADLKSLRRAADRCASCFLVGLTATEKRIATEIASKMGLTSFGELLHLIPAGANKGRAVDVLNGRLSNIPTVQNLRPDSMAEIVFGNGENDLPLFEQAIKSGGAAVLVGDSRSSSGFHFDPKQHPIFEGTIALKGVSHGNAIKQSLPLLKDFFRKNYGLVFPW